jgi:hypothetical protein
LATSEQDKKRQRKRRVPQTSLVDDDDDDDVDDIDDNELAQRDDHPFDGSPTKSVRRTGKRKQRETSKTYQQDPVTGKLSKQLTKLYDFVIKYRDKYGNVQDTMPFIMSFVLSLVRTIEY